MEHIPAPVFFRSIVEHDLGEVHGDSCWLFADGQLGKHKLVTKVAPHNILLLAAELHETCSSLAVAAANLYISEDLLDIYDPGRLLGVLNPTGNKLGYIRPGIKVVDG